MDFVETDCSPSLQPFVPIVTTDHFYGMFPKLKLFFSDLSMIKGLREVVSRGTTQF